MVCLSPAATVATTNASNNNTVGSSDGAEITMTSSTKKEVIVNKVEATPTTTQAKESPRTVTTAKRKQQQNETCADAGASASVSPTTDEQPEETRRPPKKRKKSLKAEQQHPTTASDEAQPPEERDQASRSSSGDGDDRQGVSPVTTKPVAKGHGDSAWETLMNVAALVPPLPTQLQQQQEQQHPKHARIVSLGATPAAATPSPSPAKKHTQAPSPAGSSYSSKHRAINNDVVPNEQRWYDMFGRLELFKSKTGHCRVPNRYSGDASLGSWVATQRRYFKNKSLPMPPDRVKKLTDLGFEWTTKDPRKVPWETRFHDLKSFKEKFGHADVPHEWEECPQLGFWTANMRQQYRYKQLGKKSSLTDARIDLLNSIGFVWKMQGGRRKKSDPVARPNQSTPSPSDDQSVHSLPPIWAASNSVVAMQQHNNQATSSSVARQLVLDPMSHGKGQVMLSHAAAGAPTTVGGYIPPPNMPSMKYAMSAARATY